MTIQFAYSSHVIAGNAFAGCFSGSAVAKLIWEANNDAAPVLRNSFTLLRYQSWDVFPPGIRVNAEVSVYFYMFRLHLIIGFTGRMCSNFNESCKLFG